MKSFSVNDNSCVRIINTLFTSMFCFIQEGGGGGGGIEICKTQEQICPLVVK